MENRHHYFDHIYEEDVRTIVMELQPNGLHLQSPAVLFDLVAPEPAFIAHVLQTVSPLALFLEPRVEDDFR